MFAARLAFACSFVLLAGCGTGPADSESGNLTETSACDSIAEVDTIARGAVGGRLATAVCPKNEGATEPFTCAIVVEEDGGRRVGLMLRAGDDPGDVEPVLECLVGQRVAVQTTGVLESNDDAFLKQILAKQNAGTIDNTLRWGGEVSRLKSGSCDVPALEGALPAGYVAGDLEFSSCPKNEGASEPFTCAVVIQDADGKHVGLLLRSGDDPADVEPVLACLDDGASVALQTTGVLETEDQAFLRKLVDADQPIDTMLRWGGVIASRP